jgi:predicted nicotinamide N-methyase
MNLQQLVRTTTRLTSAPIVPELRLWLATDAFAAWEQAERLAGRRLPVPYWAVAWPGSQALARYVLDQGALARGARVLDFASGCGLGAIAALVAGARSALAADLDPLAEAAVRENAAACGVEVETTTDDLVGRDLADLGVDVVLAGDVCYERGPSAQIVAWLRALAAQGATVLLADPGRTFAPRDDLEALATYVVPTTLDLERAEVTPTTVWRVL